MCSYLQKQSWKTWFMRTVPVKHGIQNVVIDFAHIQSRVMCKNPSSTDTQGRIHLVPWELDMQQLVFIQDRELI
jgi:hypothetical protein